MTNFPWGVIALRSIMTTLIVFFVISLKERVDSYEFKDKKLKKTTVIYDTLIIIFITFSAYMILNSSMYFIENKSGIDRLKN